MARIAKFAAELWFKQNGRCWSCKGPIPAGQRGTRVVLKPRYPGGKPKIGHLGLSCQSCVTGRFVVAKNGA